MGRRFFLSLLTCVLFCALAPPARAQGATVELTLVRQPVWHEPGDPLDITVRIRNTGTAPLQGYIVTLAAHARVLSRSELHASFDSPITFQASSITAIEAPGDTIAPGDTVERTMIRSKPSSPWPRRRSPAYTH